MTKEKEGKKKSDKKPATRTAKEKKAFKNYPNSKDLKGD